MASKRVLSVGQCAADHGSISWAVTRGFDAEVVPAHSAAEALEELRRGAYDLVLVNRILDRDGSSGLSLIQEIKKDEALQKTPVMLVSNYDNYQQEAVRWGALPGIGKASLGQPQTVDRLREVLA